MQVDPIEEWRRLREHYIQLNDEELYELALDFAELTEPAQQVLRDEMKSRGLDLPRAHSEVPKYRIQSHLSATESDASQPSAPNTNQAEDEQADRPHEYTWKTQLCECETTSRRGRFIRSSPKRDLIVGLSSRAPGTPRHQLSKGYGRGRPT